MLSMCGTLVRSNVRIRIRVFLFASGFYREQWPFWQLSQDRAEAGQGCPECSEPSYQAILKSSCFTAMCLYIWHERMTSLCPAMYIPTISWPRMKTFQRWRAQTFVLPCVCVRRSRYFVDGIDLAKLGGAWLQVSIEKKMIQRTDVSCEGAGVGLSLWIDCIRLSLLAVVSMQGRIKVALLKLPRSRALHLKPTNACQ